MEGQESTNSNKNNDSKRTIPQQNNTTVEVRETTNTNRNGRTRNYKSNTTTTNDQCTLTY